MGRLVSLEEYMHSLNSMLSFLRHESVTTDMSQMVSEKWTARCVAAMPGTWNGMFEMTPCPFNPAQYMWSSDINLRVIGAGSFGSAY